MQKNSKKITIITNIILSFILICIFTISFLPSSSDAVLSTDVSSVIYNGNREKEQISLMFNVYENKEVVNKIIDTLDDFSVKATFFVGGCWADDNDETLKKIVNCGHEIANHGYFHKDHKTLSYEKNKEEIVLTNKIVKALCGVETKLFAPPSGSFSKVTLKVCTDLGYSVIMWSKDTIDWRDSDTSLIYKRATNNVQNGDLILMHPKSHTLEILPKIIDFYIKNGYSIVTVSENISGE